MFWVQYAHKALRTVWRAHGSQARNQSCCYLITATRNCPNEVHNANFLPNGNDKGTKPGNIAKKAFLSAVAAKNDSHCRVQYSAPSPPIQNQSSGLCRVAALDNSQRKALLPKSLCHHHLQRQCWQSQTEWGGSILRTPVGNGTPEEEARNQWREWKRAESATELLGYCWSKGKWLCDVCRAEGRHYWLWGGKEEEPGTYWR